MHYIRTYKKDATIFSIREWDSELSHYVFKSFK